MNDSVIMIIGVLALGLILKLMSAYLSVIIRFINRYTFNIIPNTLNFVGSIFGTGLSVFFTIALLLGFSTGFFALYKGTTILSSHISRHYSSVKVIGQIIDVDNSPNMSDALVGFTDEEGRSHEFVYTASYNGTVFHVGDKVPVYYLPNDILRSATLTLSGGYVATGFFYLYGFAVAGYFVLNIYLTRKKAKRAKRSALIDQAPVYLKLPVRQLLPVNGDVIIQCDYKDPFTGKEYHYFSQKVKVSEADKIRLENAFFTVTVNPENYSHYEFDMAQIKRVIGKYEKVYSSKP